MITVVTLIQLTFSALLSVGYPSFQGMESYVATIPGTTVTFDMVAIPKGTFQMGSPASENGRNADEGPTGTVTVDAFWMGKCEVTWDEYELFVYAELEKQATASKVPDATRPLVDGVTRPTPPFMDMSFGMGKSGFPAVNMTQYAAMAYCKWLTAKTGKFHRLPTEAEWEYACRAGTQTAYGFGSDASQLGAYAWYLGNSGGKYHTVGTRKPNAWGLHDMHGNVAEWTLDQYVADFYRTRSDTKNPWAKATRLYPHAVRGGHWEAPAPALRSAARGQSRPEWKQRDPQIPKSDWWLTDASFVGFRIVRPLKQPTAAQIEAYFTSPLPDY
ncbi:formylglycine-generating enzyme family protein [Parapedobacter indicus]|uniref:Formylglycine-generating enzyme, required for sulfatase activity, contains SUMF1/FGE domain n=1 Tax=Parapedobacter indicus TaxID=1477437 RepID=A0A1I3KE04_9SPHI|nr:SUMF1/EgtB/PvdO family nonheme iron enzyme [Parapedobacter indicus]PPL01794.1 formylglycine-generating enzyme required for sulfatase activity [Parapedobacter indicus]SFI70739.1 Formylglycine-generating enzyme, required for sulfatase activity, contains SUMF1/FGE domain [Parapedobacter indicus]